MNPHLQQLADVLVGIAVRELKKGNPMQLAATPGQFNSNSNRELKREFNTTANFVTKVD